MSLLKEGSVSSENHTLSKESNEGLLEGRYSQKLKISPPLPPILRLPPLALPPPPVAEKDMRKYVSLEPKQNSLEGVISSMMISA